MKKESTREDESSAGEEELSPTLEDYVRAIYRIERKRRAARPKDIRRSQKVANSTVTAALQIISRGRSARQSARR